MDLGSAVLSAETALDFLAGERRERVLLCEAPLVEGAVAAAVAARIGQPLAAVAEEARRGLEPKAAHLGDGEVPAEGADDAGAEGEWQVLRLPVRNRLGLHARPAARFVQTASGFDARIEVENATTRRGPVPARSLSAVATLGVRRGHEIVVRASGREAARALDALRALAEAGFGEGEMEVPPAAPPPPQVATELVEPPAAGSTLVGLPAAPGLVLGRVRRLGRVEIEIPERRAGDPGTEWGELERALAAGREAIRATRRSVAARSGEDEAAIFDAHLLLLEDEGLLAPARASIFDRHENAARAWTEAVEAAAREWRGLEDEYLRARADDVLEVGRRVLALLAGDGLQPHIDAPGILVAPDLAPGETAELDPEVVRGIATARGGPTSHSAILARALGVPAVVGLGEELLALAEDTTLLLDGDVGAIHVEPSAALVREYEARRRAREEAERRAWATAAHPAVTRDGRRIEVAANVGSIADVEAALAAAAEGVGLLRTEFLFLDRPALPDEDEQAAAYREIARRLDGRPLILRTLDAGADKPLPSIAHDEEANPFLGLRGLRLTLDRPEILVVQLKAALRVAVEFPLKLMFPMVASVGELRAARKLLDEARADLARDGSTVPAVLEVGVMIEVPAAALAADRLAPAVDFFSIGTNDLAQYTMAADRDNARVAGLADALEPAVLALVTRVAEAAVAHGKWVGVCGEAAGDLAAVPLLVGLGAHELSAAPSRVPLVKQVVRGLDYPAARRLAAEALALESASDVRALVARETGPPLGGVSERSRGP
jgi:phosphocarrier protein FPr